VSQELDNAAEAALFMLGLTQNPKVEHLGALYAGDQGIARTGTVDGNDQHTHGTLSVPHGSLLALFHNHPNIRGFEGGDGPSQDDIAQAQRLKVPSYISTPSGRTRRFDPSTGKVEDVLAEFPIDEWRAYLMQKLLNRAPDDPRGLYLLGGGQGMQR
jgi:hypothetical protein